MAYDGNDYNDVERILGKVFDNKNTTLKDLFNSSLVREGLTFSGALTKLRTEHRALNGVFEASQKHHDLLMLDRLAKFLEIPTGTLVEELIAQLQVTFADELQTIEKELFIKNSFDLPYLKKIGLIDNLRDLAHVEERLVAHFGYSSIFEYGRETIGVAFSSGNRKSKSLFGKTFWAEQSLKLLNTVTNYFEYDRDALKEYIPLIRWHSTNVKRGLSQVIRDLFKLGITVIVRPRLPNVDARGATFATKDDKPAIVLTNYSDLYPSLWFALLHELHHVLFDWSHIREVTYHITGELDLFSKQEVEADDFANTILLPDSKFKIVKPHIDNQTFVEEFARANQMHSSVVYARYCWAMQDSDKKVWAKYRNRIPDALEAMPSLPRNPWQTKADLKQIAKQTQDTIFKGI